MVRALAMMRVSTSGLSSCCDDRNGKNKNMKYEVYKKNNGNIIDIDNIYKREK